MKLLPLALMLLVTTFTYAVEAGQHDHTKATQSEPSKTPGCQI